MGASTLFLKLGFSLSFFLLGMSGEARCSSSAPSEAIGMNTFTVTLSS